MATPVNLPSTFNVGQVFTSAEANALRGAFRILQIVYGTYTVAVGTSSTTWVDTGLTATITPQSNTSKILIYADHSAYSLVAGTGGGIKLLRDATQLQIFADIGYNTGGNNLTTWSTMNLDSPATTSALTYKTQQNRGSGTGTFYTQVNSNPANLILMEVSA